MAENENFDSQNQATIERWRRKRMRDEDRAEHMESNMRKSLSKMLKDGNIRRGVAIDLKEATKNKNKYEFEGGYGVYDDGEIITGFNDIPDWDD